MISVGLSLWANKARQDAKLAAKTADSHRIAALSEAERDKHLDRSLLLAVEALRVENSFEATNSLFRALLMRPGVLSFLTTAEGNIACVAFSPDGKTLAAGYDHE